MIGGAKVATRRAAVVGLVLAVMTGVAIGVAMPRSQAATSPFPTVRAVKAAVNGTGAWQSSRYVSETLGGRPSDCRSDQQMVGYRSRGERHYVGPVGAALWAGADVTVLRYDTVALARTALARSASYPRRCPRVTEWVCEECDGISTTWRTRVALPRVGVESVGWSFKDFGNLKSSGYSMVARRGATLVHVTLARTHVRNFLVYPRLPSKSVIADLARLALRTAL